MLLRLTVDSDGCGENGMEGLPGWLQGFASIVVFMVVTASTVYAYFHARGLHAGGHPAVAGRQDSDVIINHFFPKALDALERSATATQRIASAAEETLELMKRRDDELEIERRVLDRIRVRQQTGEGKS